MKSKLAPTCFKDIIVEEFEANENFGTIQDVLMRLENPPIIPDFDREGDMRHGQKIV